MATKKLTTVVIDALEDIKARDIKLINVSRITSVFDYIAVASADSTRQTKALAKNVMDKVKENGGWIYGIEGEQSGEWVLVDCGDIVVHIMQPAMRELYELEELWGEGSLEFPKPKPVPKAVVKTTTSRADKPKVTVKKKAAAKAKSVTNKTTGIARKKVAAKVAVEKKVIAKKPVAKKPVVKKPVAKKPATKKPVAKKPTATKPTVKKPAAKKAVAKKPIAKKPSAKKPAGKRRKVAAD